MKKLILFLIAAFAFLSVSAQKNNEGDKIVGVWLTGNAKAHIQITRYGDKYGGKLVWLHQPNDENGTPKLDNKNPNESKRKTPLLGLNNLLGFVYIGKGKYQDGTIYDPKNGKTYNCVMTLESDNTLKVRGYVGISLIGRTDTWTKVR